MSIADEWAVGSSLTVNAIAGRRVTMRATGVEIDKSMPNIDKLGMLMLHVTELTGAMSSAIEGGDNETIETALVSIAAVAAAWLDSYDLVD
jgi:hypothetical protein